MTLPRVVVAVAFVVGAAGGACRSSSPFELGREASRARDWDAAVQFYERALAEDPDNIEYRMTHGRALLSASRFHLAEARDRLAAGDLEAAIDELELAIDYDPTNPYIRAELEELLRERVDRRREADPMVRVSPFSDRERILDPSSPAPLHVKFPEGSSLRRVLESLAELADVNILFDESFRDQRVSVDLEGVSYREILDLLMQTHGLFYKVVRSSTVVVTNEK